MRSKKGIIDDIFLMAVRTVIHKRPKNALGELIKEESASVFNSYNLFLLF